LTFQNELDHIFKQQYYSIISLANYKLQAEQYCYSKSTQDCSIRWANRV